MEMNKQEEVFHFIIEATFFKFIKKKCWTRTQPEQLTIKDNSISQLADSDKY